MVTVRREEIADGLRELGLRAGDGIIMHSSLSSFGYVEGGAEAVIAALEDVITEEGTLLMPSFNHGEPWGKDPEAVFDPLLTPTKNGKVADTFWRQPGVKRSWNPTHPYAAWGKRASYTRWHHRTLTMGPDSPLGMLWQDGGKCLLVGVGYGPNTFRHVVETTTGAPCLGLRTEAYPMRLPDGRIVEGRTWGWRERGCPLLSSAGLMEEQMRKRDFQRQRKIGNSMVTLFLLDDCFQVLSEVLKKGSGEHPPCSRCPIRPQVISRTTSPTVESDWDTEKGCLKPDSLALRY